MDTDALDALIERLTAVQTGLRRALARRMLQHIAANWSAQSPAAPDTPPGIISGALADSVQQVGDSVGTDLAYGRMLEYGTATMPARPWLRPAMEQTRGEAVQIAQEVWEGQEHENTQTRAAGSSFGAGLDQRF